MGLLVGDLLSYAAAARPSGVAATLGDEMVTYSDLDESANRMANASRGLGIEQGQRVVWWSGPDLSSLAAFGAFARVGAVFAPMNPALGPAEVAATLEYLHPRVVIADDDREEMAREVTAAPETAVISLRDFLVKATEASSAPAGSPIDDEQAHVIYMTSGTTGRPKGVVVSHRASWLRAFPGGSTFSTGLRGDGGILASFPLFHYGGWHYVLEAWHHRCAFHLCQRFDGADMVAAADKWKPAAMYCIPAVWHRILDAESSQGAFDSVRHADTGTSAAPPELLLRLRERMPEATRSVLYGSSEGGHHTTLSERDIERKPGSVGRVAPPGVIRISGDGEVLYTGPTLMDGYFERPDETASAMKDGWYHTGDLGFVDREGYLHIVGRLREVIRTGGESVAPVEVEAALGGLDAVDDLAVIGLPDETWGEIVCAAVVVSKGRPAPSLQSVREHVGSTLAPYKHPRRLVVVDSIPRTSATGQVQRTLLRERVAALEG